MRFIWAKLERSAGTLEQKINRLPAWQIVLGLAILFALPGFSYNFTDAHGDLAEVLNNPLRVLDGETPYKDFWLLQPPGVVYFPAFLYRLFGVNINAVMLGSFAVNVLCGLAGFFLARTLVASQFTAAVTAVLVYFNGMISLAYGYNDARVWFLALIISAWCLVRFFRKKDDCRSLRIAGYLAGFAFFWDFFLVGTFCFSAVIAIAANEYFRKGSAYVALRPVVLFFLCTAAVVGVEAYLIHDYIYPAIFAVIIDAPRHASSEIFHTSFVKESLYSVESMVVFLSPFLMLACYAVYAGDRWAKPEMVMATFFLLWVMAALPKALARSDLNHMAQAATPMYFFFAMFFDEKSLFGEKAVWTRAFLRGYILVAVFLLLAFDVQKMMEHTVNDHLKPSFLVQTEHGKLRFNDARAAENANKAVAIINELTSPGDYIFVAAWDLPPLYALTRRRGATYFDSPIDFEARPAPESQRAVCADLEKRKVKLVFYDRDYMGLHKGGIFLPIEIMNRCISEKYRLIYSLPASDVFVRRADAPAANVPIPPDGGN